LIGDAGRRLTTTNYSEDDMPGDGEMAVVTAASSEIREIAQKFGRSGWAVHSLAVSAGVPLVAVCSQVTR
jgi:hypothetical protein